MGYESLSGLKTMAMKATRGVAVITGALDPNVWYEIKAVAATGSTLPIGEVSGVFRSPDTTSTAITLAVGDEVYPLTLDQVCKTDAEITAEEGTIDVTDDCENGFNAMILDGYKTISGTLNGFLKFDDETGELVTGASEIMSRFFNVVSDDGEGSYVVTAASNEKFLLFMALNKDAGVGDVQNWLIIPVLLSSLGTGSGLKDAQKRDLSWTKAQGYVSLYKRTVFDDDIL